MRVINVSSERGKIRKGTELAICEPIVSVTPSQPTNEDREKTLMEPLPDHLKPLLKKSVESLSEEQSKQVSTLLTVYQDMFSKGLGDLGRAAGVKHKIETGEAIPVKQPQRRIPIKKREVSCRAIEEMVEEMEQQKILEPSTSP